MVFGKRYQYDAKNNHVEHQKCYETYFPPKERIERKYSMWFLKMSIWAFGVGLDVSIKIGTH